jgi:hypothetical protein
MRLFDAWGIAMLLHHIDEQRAFAQKMCDGGDRDDRLTRGQIDVFATPIIHLASYHAQRADLQSTYDQSSPVRFPAGFHFDDYGVYQELSGDVVFHPVPHRALIFSS